MLPFATLLNPLSIILSLSTATGVLIHDTTIDKAAVVALAPLAVMATYDGGEKKIGGNPHTHTERGSLSQAVRDLKAQNPRVLPRFLDDRKHITQKKLPFQLDGYGSNYSFYQ